MRVERAAYAQTDKSPKASRPSFANLSIFPLRFFEVNHFERFTTVAPRLDPWPDSIGPRAFQTGETREDDLPQKNAKESLPDGLFFHSHFTQKGCR